MKIFSTDYDRMVGRRWDGDGMDRIYFRSDNAIVNSGKTLYRSSWMQQIHIMSHVAVRIGRVGKGIEERYASRYYSESAMCFSLVDRSYVQKRMQAGLDPMLGYSFDGALVLGDMKLISEMNTIHPKIQILEKGYVKKEVEHPLLFPTSEHVDEVISMLSHYFLLKMGDLVTFPLWETYITIDEGEYIQMAFADQELLFMGLK